MGKQFFGREKYILFYIMEKLSPFHIRENSSLCYKIAFIFLKKMWGKLIFLLYWG